MKVRMNIQITGTRDGKPWPAVGKTVDLPKAEADRYIAQGYCTPVKSQKAVSKPAGEKRG